MHKKPKIPLWNSKHVQKGQNYPFPPLQTAGLARDGLPGGGGGDGRQVTVSRGGGGLQGYFKANCGTLHRDRGRFAWVGLPVNCTMASLPSSVTLEFGFKKASNVDCKLRFRGTFAAIVGCVGCAGVWGCGAMGVTSGDSGDLGDSTATASSLESSALS